MMARIETLQDLIAALRAFGPAPALIALRRDDEETWSFESLAERAQRLANGLPALGVDPGDAVALIGSPSPAWVAVFLGVVAAGAAALPLDPELGETALARMLSESRCRLAFVDCAIAKRLRSSERRQFAFDPIPDQPQQSGWQAATSETPRDLPRVEQDNIALLVYTSGTTGEPKSVPLSHANVAANLNALLDQNLVAAHDRVLLPLPLHHVYPLVVGLLTPLVSGATIVLPAGLSGPELGIALRRGVTHMVGVPRLFAAFTDAIRSGVAAKGWLAAVLFRMMQTVAIAFRRSFGLRVGRLLFHPLHRRYAPDLRLTVSGGAALDADVEWMLLGLGWDVLAGYGLTETAPILAFNRCGKARVGTAGQALPGVSLRIAEADEHGVGEVQAKGPNVFAGYRDNPAATAATFTRDGWFRTGDLGTLDRDGYLSLVARTTETIVLPDGKKIFPETLEDVYGRLPPVREIAVLAQAGVLVGLVVPNFEAIRALGGGRIEDVVRGALTRAAVALPSYQRLAGFALTPNPLPRTRLGKLRRHLLPALYDRAREGRVERAAAPPSPQDQTLLANPIAARLWQWLGARYAGTPLSLETNPQLDLGIDSLAWITLTLDLEHALGIVLDEAALARVTTLRDLLQAAASAECSASQPGFKAVDERWLRPRSAGLRLAHAVVEHINRSMMKVIFGATAGGSKFVPARGPCLICPNHTSYLDPFAVAAGLPRRVAVLTNWGGWTGILFRGRLQRLFSRVVGVLPVTPGRPGASLAFATAVLKRGGFLVWFPEGARSPDGMLQRFQPGVGVLVRETGTSVVPVWIDGAYAAWPPNRRFPRLGKVSVRFGQPLTAAELLATGAEPQQIADCIRTAVARLASDGSE